MTGSLVISCESDPLACTCKAKDEAKEHSVKVMKAEIAASAMKANEGNARMIEVEEESQMKAVETDKKTHDTTKVAPAPPSG